jgi:DNA-binding MarR family transcriptional regulator
MVDLERQNELREAIELFYFAYRDFTIGPDRILERRGLGRVHHRILYFVGRNPDIGINKLLETLAVSKQALNAPLRQLLEMKLIISTSGAHDRRVRQLRLTADGQKLEAQLTGTQTKALAQAFETAGSAAEAGWRKAMRAMTRA